MAITQQRSRVWEMFSPQNWMSQQPSPVMKARGLLDLSLHGKPEEAGSHISKRTHQWQQQGRQPLQRERRWTKNKASSSYFPFIHITQIIFDNNTSEVWVVYSLFVILLKRKFMQ